MALILVAISSCKHEKLSIVKAKDNISIVKVDGELFIRQETNGKIEMHKKIDYENYSLTPYQISKNLFGLQMDLTKNTRKNKASVLADVFYDFYQDRYLCDKTAENSCGEGPFGLKVYEGEYCNLIVHFGGADYDLRNFGGYSLKVATPEEIAYLDCWAETDPNNSVVKRK